MKAIIKIVMLIAIFIAQAEWLLAETKVALLIGNGAYGADPLSNPENDVMIMEKALLRLGWDTFGQIDADQKRNEKITSGFREQAQNQ